MNRFIVAEITKNWTAETPVTDLLSHRFESVINVNLVRGYKLIDWKINTIVNGRVLTETIIAIFELNTPVAVTDEDDDAQQRLSWAAVAGGIRSGEDLSFYLEHYKLTKRIPHIHLQKKVEANAKDNWDGICRCGHKHSEHGKSHSINYSAGKCSIEGCNCMNFLMPVSNAPAN